MRERPIIFSGPMVRAILEGRKTQTRRKLKADMADLLSPNASNIRVTNGRVVCDWRGGVYSLAVTCPYGAPGDRLWVRETWNLCLPELVVPGEFVKKGEGGYSHQVVVYGAGQTHDTHPEHPEWGKMRWRPSIHMPRWASRITLEITGVRVERLQKISEEDAMAEGIERVGGPTSCNPWRNYQLGTPGEMSMHCSFAARSFQTLWSTIHAADGPDGWAANPWCWVIEFKKLEAGS